MFFPPTTHTHPDVMSHFFPQFSFCFLSYIILPQYHLQKVKRKYDCWRVCDGDVGCSYPESTWLFPSGVSPELNCALNGSQRLRARRYSSSSQFHLTSFSGTQSVFTPHKSLWTLRHTVSVQHSLWTSQG